MEGKILIYNNCSGIAEKIMPHLMAEGLRCRIAQDGDELAEELQKEEVMVLIVDAKLNEDGSGRDIGIIERTRKSSCVPLLVISDQKSAEATICALETGADDYVTSDCSVLEIVARVKAQVRHYFTIRKDREVCPRVLKAGEITLDGEARSVMVGKERVNLTPKEYQILYLLMANMGRVFSGKEIYEKVWEMCPFGSEGTILVHISNLRRKIEKNPNNPQYLKKLWGQGYYFAKG